MHLVAGLPAHISDQQLSQQAEQEGLGCARCLGITLARTMTMVWCWAMQVLKKTAFASPPRDWPN
jgi:hypothetical protein